MVCPPETVIVSLTFYGFSCVVVHKLRILVPRQVTLYDLIQRFMTVLKASPTDKHAKVPHMFEGGGGQAEAETKGKERVKIVKIDIRVRGKEERNTKILPEKVL